MKKITIFLISIITTTILTGCFGGSWRNDAIYSGFHPELFTVAVRSLLSTDGGDMRRYLPTIDILEKDNYGRTLFEYSSDGISARLVMQKVEGEYAYFYPYYNFILNTRRAISRTEHTPDFQDDQMREKWIEFQQELRSRNENELEESDIREMMDSILRRTEDYPERQMSELKYANSWNWFCQI